VKQLGISFQPSINQDETLSLLIIITFLLEARFQLSLLQKLIELTLIRTRAVRVLTSLQLLIRFFPILAKSPKKVNEIAKYFKKNKQSKEKKNDQKILYTQVLTPINNTRDVLKIKEIFPNLQTKKIQKIINSKNKLKLRLHMTIKELLRKQVIVPMSNDNKTKFMIDLSAHIVNINRVL